MLDFSFLYPVLPNQACLPIHFLGAETRLGTSNSLIFAWNPLESLEIFWNPLKSFGSLLCKSFESFETLKNI